MKKFYIGLVSIIALSAILSQNFNLSKTAFANGNAQSVPFSQNWSNPSLITTNDDWNSVPGIIGYRGDNLTGSTGTDPQTILADGSATPVNAWANQTDPNVFASGGVAEFDALPNPTIALNGSGTADAPHFVINLNTLGTTAINVAYNLRDLDGSADDAVQPVALQYRVGSSGNYTNIAAAFVADATAPNQATLVTPVSAALPAACENQPLVQLRVMTTNANGNDEWVGVDDIAITGTGGGPTQLSASGIATPATVTPGGATLLTVTVTPATNPASTGITVVGNLSNIGGSPTQTLFDDGSNGDATPGDNVFSYSATVPVGTAGGPQSVTAVASDAQARTANANINVNINAPAPNDDPLLLGNPSGAIPNVISENNYLMVKPQYSLSYNRNTATPNWVAWRLDSSWLGSAPRQDDYRPDPDLPAAWYHVTDNDYSGSGYTRGHMCPSGDRQNTIPNNSATFLMTNFVPQIAENNSGAWEDFETYCRTLANQGNEIYIISGGNGSLGTIAQGRVTVPKFTWKVVLIIPNGNNDLERINKQTRTIGLIMPNYLPLNSNALWRQFRVTVDQVEALTGYNFFANIPKNTQKLIERRRDIQ